jgi:hypothetical protein
MAWAIVGPLSAVVKGNNYYFFVIFSCGRFCYPTGASVPRRGLLRPSSRSQSAKLSELKRPSIWVIIFW